MIKKCIEIGNKVDVSRHQKMKNGEDFPILSSKVVDILENNIIVIAMPMDKTVTVPLSKGEKADLFFYTAQGIYSAAATSIDRYYEGKFPMLKMELTSMPEKFQRRQYFRIECYIPFRYHILTNLELGGILEFRGNDRNTENRVQEHIDMVSEVTGTWSEGVIVNISGGGIRFVTDTEVPKTASLLLEVDINQEEQDEEVPKEADSFNIISSIVSVESKREIKGKYEIRAKFYKIKDTFRDNIVKFVFDEERKLRNRSNGMEFRQE